MLIDRSLHWGSFESPLGTLTAVVDDVGRLVELHLDGRGLPFPAEPDRVAAVRRQLDEYFAGRRRTFELALRPRGTPFQQTVWNALATIPYGEVRHYRAIADLIGKPRATRAVGQANGANPIAIVVPCHRVIASDGSIGGYAGGVAVKMRLLALEGHHYAS